MYDINETVKKSAQMFGRTRKEITIHSKYQESVWTVEADQGQIEQVLVESHTSFLGENTLKLKSLLSADLQVAIGLETVNPRVLESLNKGMSLDDFRDGVEFLWKHGISARAFILLRPPFMTEEEGVEWACKSLDFAFRAGVEVCSVIPVRSGNGAMDVLAAAGHHQEPRMTSLEQVLDYGVGLNKGNVFADLLPIWDDRSIELPTLQQ